MKKLFRILAFTLCFTVSILTYEQQKAQASPLIGALAIGTGVTVSAPVVISVVAVGIAAGLVLSYPNEIRRSATGIINYLSSVGQGIGTGIQEMADGTVKVTASAKESLKTWLAQIRSAPTTAEKITMKTSIHVDAYSQISTGFQIPLESGMSRTFNVNSLTFSQPYNTQIKIKNNYDGSILTAGNPIQLNITDNVDMSRYDIGNTSIPYSQASSIEFIIYTYGPDAQDYMIEEWVYPVSSATTLPANPTYQNDIVGSATDTVFNPSTSTTETDLIGATPTTVTDVVPAVNSTVGQSALETDVPGLKTNILDRFHIEKFDNTWDKIRNMDTSRGVPPKIEFNMRSLFNAATSRFGAPAYPFSKDVYTLVDFGDLQSYEYAGLPLIDYFRGLVATGFIMTTAIYVWRKIIPSESIGG